MHYIEMHRGPAAYVLGPPPSRSRYLELEGGVIACHVDYVRRYDTTALGLLKKEEEEEEEEEE